VVRVRTWCRADLGGGTLDIWPLGLLHPGACTVNVALDLAVEVRLESRRQGFVVTQNGERLEAERLEELAAARPRSARRFRARARSPASDAQRLGQSCNAT